MAGLSDVARDERTARMVLSMLVEPNDPVTGRIVARLGAVETREAIQAAQLLPEVAGRTPPPRQRHVGRILIFGPFRRSTVTADWQLVDTDDNLFQTQADARQIDQGHRIQALHILGQRLTESVVGLIHVDTQLLKTT